MKNSIYKYKLNKIISLYRDECKAKGHPIPRDTVKSRLQNLDNFLFIGNINTIGKRYSEAITGGTDSQIDIEVFHDDAYYSDDDKLIIIAWLNEFEHEFIKLFPMDKKYGYYTIPLNRQTEEYSASYQTEYLGFQERMQKLISELSDEQKKEQILTICDYFSVFDTTLVEEQLPKYYSSFQQVLNKVEPSKRPELRQRAEKEWLEFLKKIKDEFEIDVNNGQEVFPYVRKSKG